MAEERLAWHDRRESKVGRAPRTVSASVPGSRADLVSCSRTAVGSSRPNSVARSWAGTLYRLGHRRRRKWPRCATHESGMVRGRVCATNAALMLLPFTSSNGVTRYLSELTRSMDTRAGWSRTTDGEPIHLVNVGKKVAGRRLDRVRVGSVAGAGEMNDDQMKVLPPGLKPGDYEIDEIDGHPREVVGSWSSMHKHTLLRRGGGVQALHTSTCTVARAGCATRPPARFLTAVHWWAWRQAIESKAPFTQMFVADAHPALANAAAQGCAQLALLWTIEWNSVIDGGRSDREAPARTGFPLCLP